MQFQETEEQSMIRDMVRDFAEEVLAPTCLARDKAQEPPVEEWAQFIEYGLQSCTIPEEFGGVPLLGVNGVIIVSHGNSSPKAVKNSPLAAKKCITENLLGDIQRGITEHMVAVN